MARFKKIIGTQKGTERGLILDSKDLISLEQYQETIDTKLAILVRQFQNNGEVGRKEVETVIEQFIRNNEVILRKLERAKRNAERVETNKIGDIRKMLATGANTKSSKLRQELDKFGQHLRFDTLSVLRYNRRRESRLRREKAPFGYILKKIRKDKYSDVEVAGRGYRISQSDLKEHQLFSEIDFLISSLNRNPDEATLDQLKERINKLTKDYLRDLDDFLTIEVDIDIQEARKFHKIDHYITFLHMFGGFNDSVKKLKALKKKVEFWVYQDAIDARNLIYYSNMSFNSGISLLDTAKNRAKMLKDNVGQLVQNNKRTPEKLDIKLEKPIGDEGEQWAETRAILRSNETYKPEVGQIVRKAFNPRFFIGIGFGNSLNHIPDFFVPSQLEGMVFIDMSSDVIDTALVVRELLKQNKTPRQFMQTITDSDALKEQLNSISLQNRSNSLDFIPGKFWNWDNNLHQPGFDTPLIKRTPEDVEDIITSKVNRFHRGPSPIKRDIIQADSGITIMQNYALFRKLAVDGRMGILRADITDEKLKDLKKMRGYKKGPIVFYGTNLFSEHIGSEPEIAIWKRIRTKHPVIFTGNGKEAHIYAETRHLGTAKYSIYPERYRYKQYVRRALSTGSTTWIHYDVTQQQKIYLSQGEKTPKEAIELFNKFERQFGLPGIPKK